MNYLIGFILSFIISYFAYKRDSLSFSGFLSALSIGIIMNIFGGIFFFILMISFFISSTLLTKYKKSQKDAYDVIYEKSGKRDHTQVLSNSIPAFVFGLLFYLTKQTEYILAYASVFSATNSDTWASEIGVLSKSNPISILTGKKVRKGISGGITSLGMISSFLGSIFLSIIFIIGYCIKYDYEYNIFLLFTICSLSGFLGSIIDSILGDSIQSKYLNKNGDITEKRYENGFENTLIKGFNFINNNIINLISSFLSGLISLIVFKLIY